MILVVVTFVEEHQAGLVIDAVLVGGDQSRPRWLGRRRLDLKPVHFLDDADERTRLAIAIGRRQGHLLRQAHRVDDIRGVFDAMQDKALLRLEAPLGTFFLREENDAPVLLVGGGTGFAPLKAMLEDALPRLPQRRFHLFWGARARRDLYLDALPRAWADQYPNFRYTPVLSEAMSGDVWTGEAGWVHEAVLRLYPNLAGNEVYMSGPPPMVAAARDAFVACGLDPERLYFDSFEYAAA